MVEITTERSMKLPSRDKNRPTIKSCRNTPKSAWGENKILRNVHCVCFWKEHPRVHWPKFTTYNEWRQTKYFWKGEWIKKMGHMYTTQYDSVGKRRNKEIFSNTDKTRDNQSEEFRSRQRQIHCLQLDSKNTFQWINWENTSRLKDLKKQTHAFSVS